ncbi:hypothetical protein AMAG_13701 [Allomyces macrogynus ATCC 38327]|uniref:RRM domain-containing protein n=1 Tax=Allomyces macrogynus (strain ATCC 38327) TaxID=578462 RepID=A0A0L0T424_ALLM3|nr:hypothetical protein AMAG_13701 [Allomyces macrogynus ATCC 38327]|eukprot:KNE69329.1 hypothetical protein AMAG_13701 [Allomyces macrogynus ATCC 38327]
MTAPDRARRGGGGRPRSAASNRTSSPPPPTDLRTVLQRSSKPSAGGSSSSVASRLGKSTASPTAGVDLRRTLARPAAQADLRATLASTSRASTASREPAVVVVKKGRGHRSRGSLTTRMLDEDDDASSITAAAAAAAAQPAPQLMFTTGSTPVWAPAPHVVHMVPYHVQPYGMPAPPHAHAPHAAVPGRDDRAPAPAPARAPPTTFQTGYTVRIANLHSSVTADDVKAQLSPFGEILGVTMPTTPNGERVGVALVTYSTASAGFDTIAKLHDVRSDGLTLKVDWHGAPPPPLADLEAAARVRRARTPSGALRGHGPLPPVETVKRHLSFLPAKGVSDRPIRL